MIVCCCNTSTGTHKKPYWQGRVRAFLVKMYIRPIRIPDLSKRKLSTKGLLAWPERKLGHPKTLSCRRGWATHLFSRHESTKQPWLKHVALGQPIVGRGCRCSLHAKSETKQGIILAACQHAGSLAIHLGRVCLSYVQRASHGQTMRLLYTLDY